MVRAIEGALVLTPKEVECLTEMYNRLNQLFPNQYRNVEVETVLEKLAKDRTITLQQLKVFLKWRRPKGAVACNPCYARFLERYFRLRGCKACESTGHDEKMQVCKSCHGSGFDQTVAHMLDDNEGIF